MNNIDSKKGLKGIMKQLKNQKKKHESIKSSLMNSEAMDAAQDGQLLDNSILNEEYLVVKATSPLENTLIGSVPVNELKITDESKLGTAPTYLSERESADFLRFEPALKTVKEGKSSLQPLPYNSNHAIFEIPRSS